MNYLKKTSFFVIGFLLPLYASSASLSLPSRVFNAASQWTSDRFYGAAFRDSSVSIQGCKSGDEIPYFQSHLSSSYSKKNISIKNQQINFWEANIVANDGFRHIVVPSFIIKGTEYIADSLTLDPITTFRWPNEGKISDFTCAFLQEIMKSYPKSIIHVLVSGDGIGENGGRRDHANYLQIQYNEGALTHFKIFEPWSSSASWGNPSYDASRIEQLKSKLTENGFLNFNVDLITRGDQRRNPHDCGRFALIYLMFALEGKSVENLQAKDIYNGIQRFILGEKGYLSFQRKQITFDDVEIMISEGKVQEEIKQEYEQKKQSIRKIETIDFERLRNESNEEFQKYFQGITNLKNEFFEKSFSTYSGRFDLVKQKAVEFLTNWGGLHEAFIIYMNYQSVFISSNMERSQYERLSTNDLLMKIKQVHGQQLPFMPGYGMRFVQTYLNICAISQGFWSFL